MSDITLTTGETKLITLVCKHIKTLDVDWDALATEGGYASAVSGRNTWNALKRKKLSGEIATTPKKRKNDGLQDGEVGMTPSPAPKKAKRGAKAKTTDTEAATKAGHTAANGDDQAGAEVKEEPVE